MLKNARAPGVGSERQDARRGGSGHSLCPWGHGIVSSSIVVGCSWYENHGGKSSSIRDSIRGCTTGN